MSRDTTRNLTGEARIDRYIDVWVKSGGRWQMVGWQSTPFPPK